MTRPAVVSVLLSLAVHCGLLRVSVDQPAAPLGLGKPKQSPVNVELVAAQAPPEEIAAREPDPEKAELPPVEELQKPEPKPKLKKRPIAAPAAKSANLANTAQQTQSALESQPVLAQSQAPLVAPSADVYSVYNPKPTYPSAARRLRHEGTTVLRVFVSVAGRATSVSVERSSGFPELDESAVKTVQNWRFRAGTRSGINIESEIVLPIRFQLVD